MKEARIWFLVIVLVVTASVLSVLALRFAPGARASLHAAREEADRGATRIVSLAPGITEVLFALGVGDRVVGRTDFCTYPPEATQLSIAGTGISPNYEALVGMKPDLILTESSRAAQLSQLAVIAPTRDLQWLTLEKTLISLGVMGEILDVKPQAEALAEKFRSTLGVPAPTDGPRVLMLLGMPSEGSALWFAQRNSLHGRAMHAAGMRNAVAEEITGAPSMSYERLVEVNPEVIVVMLPKDEISSQERAAGSEFLERFPMVQAVSEKSIGFLPGRGFFNNGPRLLQLVEELKRMRVGLEQKERSP